MVARVIPVERFDLVIFGATGDLSRRKILPGLFRRLAAGQMPGDARIIGAARSDMQRADFQKMVGEALDEFDPNAEIGTIPPWWAGLISLGLVVWIGFMAERKFFPATVPGAAAGAED